MKYKRKEEKKMKTYYKINELGQIKKDRLSTFINNNNWVMPLMVIILTLLGGLVEGWQL